jgi:monoamine oxidase
MSRSDAFSQLRRAIRLALHSDHAGVPPREAVEHVIASQRAHRKRHDRRRFLSGVAAGIATAALAPFGPGPPRVWAVPRAAGRVAIVGAGLAGLACADVLAARGVTATIFEGSARAGGRCFSLSGVFPG